MLLVHRTLKAFGFSLLVLIGSGSAGRTQDVRPVSIHWHDITQSCAKDCFFSFYAGQYIKSEMTNAFGIEKFEPPNQWRFGKSGLVAGTVGRTMYSVSDLFRTEVEIGAGKRFGSLTATETWAALYFRWRWFPWNGIVRTSIAVSTGLSYTPTLDEIERRRNNNGGRGIQTAALPES